MKRKSKGQIFVVGVVLLVVILALFRESFFVNPPSTMTSDDLLDNIEKEFRYTAGISHKAQADRLSNLSSFFRSNVDGFEGLYMIVFTEAAEYTVHTGNFLRAKIDGEIDVSGSSPSSETISVADGSVQIENFDATGNVTLELTYTAGGPDISEEFNFDTDGRTTVFYDIAIKENDKVLRRKGTVLIV